MATPAEPDVPSSAARAHSRLSAADLAAGLIAEESRSHSKSNMNPATSWQQELDSAPLALLTPTERLSRFLKKTSQWGEKQTRRLLNRSTYADVISRQGSEKQTEIGKILWREVTSSKELQRSIHNNELPRTLEFIEKAGEEITTLNANVSRERQPPRLNFPKEVPSRSTSDVPPRGGSAESVSRHDPVEESFLADVRTAERWLRLNPAPEQQHRTTQVQGPKSASRDENKRMENSGTVHWHGRASKFTEIDVDGVKAVSNPIDVQQYLPPMVRSPTANSSSVSGGRSTQPKGNSAKPRTR